MHPVTLTVAVGVCVVLNARRQLDASSVVDALTLRAVMAIGWPMLIVHLLPREDREHTALIPSFVWMGLVWLYDSYSLTRSRTEPLERRPGLKVEPHTITAMSFGLCGLVGARSDSKYVHLILYAILGCIMFVLPSHDLPEDDPLAPTIDELQRSALTYSIALLLTGVALTRCAVTCHVPTTALPA